MLNHSPIEISIFCIGLSVTIFGWIADIFDCIESTKLSTHMKKYYIKFFGRSKILLYALNVDASLCCLVSKDICVSICQKIYVDFNGRNQRHRKKNMNTWNNERLSVLLSLFAIRMELKPFECVYHHIFWQRITSSNSSSSSSSGKYNRKKMLLTFDLLVHGMSLIT